MVGDKVNMRQLDCFFRIRRLYIRVLALMEILLDVDLILSMAALELMMGEGKKSSAEQSPLSNHENEFRAIFIIIATAF